jgi:large subunit ribosomal protein L2
MAMATMGRVSNANHCLAVLGKAGVNRWLGFRPTVRGTAMNPIDHPHGGKNTPSAPQTKWGKLAKWVPTHKKVLRKL